MSKFIIVWIICGLIVYIFANKNLLKQEKDNYSVFKIAFEMYPLIAFIACMVAAPYAVIIIKGILYDMPINYYLKLKLRRLTKRNEKLQRQVDYNKAMQMLCDILSELEKENKQ